MDTVEVNGETYVKQNSGPKGNRAVVVIDRGWVFAGNVTRENGRIYIDEAVWVFRWSSIGFAGVLEDPTNKDVDLRPLAGGVSRIDVPESAEIYSVPVDDSWGRP